MRGIFSRPVRSQFAPLCISACCAFMLLFGAVQRSNATITTSNKYIQADVNEATGQFRIWDVKKSGALTYGDGHTSFFNFRFHNLNSGRDTILSNSNDVLFAPCAGHMGADSVLKVQDTITSYWTKFGTQIRVRLWPFITATGTTGQIAIEIWADRVDPNASANLTGVLWQNDVAVNGDNAGGCNTGGDHPVILTGNHFDARPNQSTSTCWIGVQNSYQAGGLPAMPDYYHVAQGFPNYTCPSCGFAYAKLTGPGLTPPDTFYVGDWGSSQPGFKSVCWDVNAPYFISGNSYYDASVIYKWVVRTNPTRIKTIYGLDDTVNDLKICPGPLFKEVTYPLSITRDPVTGKYSPSPAIVRLYIINVNHDAYTATGVSPVLDLTGTKHLYFSGRSPGQRTLAGQLMPGNVSTIGAQQGYYVQWQLDVDTTTFAAKGIVDNEPVNIKINLTNASQIGDDGTVCPLNITVTGEGLPPRDTLVPITQNTAASRYQSTWTSRDNRIHDLGIDSVVVTKTNYTVVVSPFTRCDTATRLTITATVTDTSQNGCATIRIKDCAGNDTTVSVCFSPRIDSIAPQITGVDSTGKAAGAPDCNNRCRTFQAADNRATDYGLGSVKVTASANFAPLTINGGGAINAHDKTATYQLCVKDSMFVAHASLDIKDFMGNTVKQQVDYCSVVDSNPPVVRVTRGAGKVVNVLVTEIRPWDRGLSRVYLGTQTNVRTIPATITWTRDSASFQIVPVDTQQAATFDVCAEDSFYTANASDKALYYSQQPNQHQQCIPGNFAGEDTLAPNVIITTLSSTSARFEINDVHYFGGVKYPMDLGLSTIVLDSHNVVIDSGAVTVSNCDSMIRFRVKVRDTLAFCDTAAYVTVSATDCRFNASKTFRWSSPIKPDNQPPVVTSTVDATGTVQVTVTDTKPYDRGLGSVELVNPVNITPHKNTANDGRATESFSIDIIDPTKDASATLTVTDRWGASCSLPLVGTHTESIPFSYGGTSLSIGSLPILHEDESGSVQITRTGTFTGKGITKIAFDVHFDSTALVLFPGASSGSAISTISAPTSGTGHVIMQSATGISDAMPLPALTFKGLFLKNDSSVVPVTVANVVVNDGQAAKVTSADGLSYLMIPPSRVAVAPGQIVVQKNCDRSGAASLFAVNQNFPNPFWENAQVQYTIPGDGHVRMTIYDIFGNEVRTVIDADQAAGQHDVQISSAGLIPGTYFYKVRALCNTCVQEFVAVKRMVVAR